MSIGGQGVQFGLSLMLDTIRQQYNEVRQLNAAVRREIEAPIPLSTTGGGGGGRRRSGTGPNYSVSGGGVVQVGNDTSIEIANIRQIAAAHVQANQQIAQSAQAASQAVQQLNNASNGAPASGQLLTPSQRRYQRAVENDLSLQQQRERQTYIESRKELAKSIKQMEDAQAAQDKAHENIVDEYAPYRSAKGGMRRDRHRTALAHAALRTEPGQSPELPPDQKRALVSESDVTEWANNIQSGLNIQDAGDRAWEKSARAMGARETRQAREERRQQMIEDLSHSQTQTALERLRRHRETQARRQSRIEDLSHSQTQTALERLRRHRETQARRQSRQDEEEAETARTAPQTRRRNERARYVASEDVEGRVQQLIQTLPDALARAINTPRSGAMVPRMAIGGGREFAGGSLNEFRSAISEQMQEERDQQIAQGRNPNVPWWQRNLGRTAFRMSAGFLIANAIGNFGAAGTQAEVDSIGAGQNPYDQFRAGNAAPRRYAESVPLIGGAMYNLSSSAARWLTGDNLEMQSARATKYEQQEMQRVAVEDAFKRSVAPAMQLISASALGSSRTGARATLTGSLMADIAESQSSRETELLSLRGKLHSDEEIAKDPTKGEDNRTMLSNLEERYRTRDAIARRKFAAGSAEMSREDAFLNRSRSAGIVERGGALEYKPISGAAEGAVIQGSAILERFRSIVKQASKDGVEVDGQDVIDASQGLQEIRMGLEERKKSFRDFTMFGNTRSLGYGQSMSQFDDPRIENADQAMKSLEGAINQLNEQIKQIQWPKR